MKKVKLDTFILRGKVTDASYSYRYTLKMHTEAKAFVYITAESLTEDVDAKIYEMIWDLTQPHGFVIIKHLLKEAKTKKEEKEIRRYTKELARLISKKAIVRAKNTKNEFYDYWKAVQNAIKDEEKEDDIVEETKETKAKTKKKKKGTKFKLSEATYEDICSFNDKRILKIAEHFKFKSKDIETLRQMIIDRLNLVPADVDVEEDEDIKVDESSVAETNNSYDDGLNDDLIAENEELIAEVERLKARIQELEAINDKLTKELKNSKAECSKAINETKKAKEKVAAASSKAKEEIKPSINVEELKASIKAELKAELLEELKASLVPATVATTPQAEEPKKEEEPKAQKLTGEQLLESGKALEDMKYQELKAIGKHLKLGAKNNSPKAALLNHIKTELAKLDSDGEVAVTDVQEDIKLNTDTTTQNADTTTQNADTEEPIADDVEDDIDDDFMDGDDSYDDDFSDDEEVSSSNKVTIDPSKLSAAQVAVLKRLGRL